MEDSCVHHIEFGVRNGDRFLRLFTNQYKFSLVAERSSDLVRQWVLRSQSAVVLLTQPKLREHNISAKEPSDPYFVPWVVKPDQSQSQHLNYDYDSAYNVALKVRNLSRCVDQMTRSGVTILKEQQTHRSSEGEVQIAVVKSCIGNVIHTLVQCDDFHGTFLPGFTDVSHGEDDVTVTHFDHVTFACNCGDADAILDWYGHSFGMRRFLINRDEDEDSGFVIDTTDIGLRLKAFEYWKCAETGLCAGTEPNSIKFVVAEALPKQGPNQVDTFLGEHGGPGIQHVGLHTTDIIQAVADLKDYGVDFIEPPFTYYTEVGKLAEIEDIGQDVSTLRSLGILVDAEADPGFQLTDSEQGSGCEKGSNIRYLMQKFTKPIFDKDTFFLEIIQRIGARGFGSGNITALWRSVQAYMNKTEKDATPQ